ncbi:hypothetical protein [Parabacteroides provencensis]|uniref:hypothetical protein n=1 Tax=Parabacteroides provencensis TaxID=1944636 RepID=UPI000C14A733|nr:hypothetical protein [Parabacteroides provencensis]
MAKKRIELELVNNIPDLIRFQELVVESMPSNIPKQIANFQIDILNVLKTVGQMDISHVGVN